MSEAETPKNTASSTETIPPKKKWSLKKKLLAGAVAVIAGIVLLVSTVTSAPVKVSNMFIANVQNNAASAAYALFSQDAKNVIDPQEFTTLVNSISPILSGKPKMVSKEVNSETGKASTAKVIYEVKGSDNLTYTLTVNLTKENDEWRILNFDSTKKQTGDTTENSTNINLSVQNKCMAELNDSTMCKFAGIFANVGDYKAVMISSDGAETTSATMMISSSGNSSMVVRDAEGTTTSIVSYAGSTYVQDPSDQQWIMYGDTATDAPAILDIKKEFISSDFKNENGQKDQYINKGTETLNGLKVYKYQMIDQSKPNQESYMWFDTEDYLLRKISSEDSGVSTVMTLSYALVTIDEPSPVKQIL